jgi:hypothetical protein
MGLKRLPLGEAVERSETDEGFFFVFVRNPDLSGLITSGFEIYYPSSIAPIYRGDTFPQGKAYNNTQESFANST